MSNISISATPPQVPKPAPVPAPTPSAQDRSKSRKSDGVDHLSNERDTRTQTPVVLQPEGASPAYFTAPLKRNDALDNYARNYTAFKTANEITAQQVKAHIKEKF